MTLAEVKDELSKGFGSEYVGEYLDTNSEDMKLRKVTIKKHEKANLFEIYIHRYTMYWGRPIEDFPDDLPEEGWERLK